MEYLRETSGLTLADLAEELEDGSRTWDGVTGQMDAHLEDDLLIFRFGSMAVPATQDGLEQLGSFLDIPRTFLTGLDPDLQQHLLHELLERTPANVSLRYGNDGISEVHKPSHLRVRPTQVVASAIKVMGEDSPIVEWGATPDELFFDVMVPLDSDRGTGGDRSVGDISQGGLRFIQNRKQNLAPTVNSFLYRLACTNGMVVPDTGLTVSARGNTVEVVLAELELAAEHAFSQVEAQIEHFYALRSQPIEGDVTQAVIRIARERGLPDSRGLALARRVPERLSHDGLGHDPTMFDLVNLFTNEANNPILRGRTSSRRALEGAGGTLVRHLSDRCGTCYQAID